MNAVCPEEFFAEQCERSLSQDESYVLSSSLQLWTHHKDRTEMKVTRDSWEVQRSSPEAPRRGSTQESEESRVEVGV